MYWVWPIAFGFSLVLFAAVMKILVCCALVKVFGSLEGYQTFVRDRARMIRRQLR